MESTLKRTWAEIDLDALAHNYGRLRQHIGPKVRFLGGRWIFGDFASRCASAGDSRKPGPIKRTHPDRKPAYPRRAYRRRTDA